MQGPRGTGRRGRSFRSNTKVRASGKKSGCVPANIWTVRSTPACPAARSNASKSPLCLPGVHASCCSTSQCGIDLGTSPGLSTFFATYAAIWTVRLSLFHIRERILAIADEIVVIADGVGYSRPDRVPWCCQVIGRQPALHPVSQQGWKTMNGITEKELLGIVLDGPALSTARSTFSRKRPMRGAAVHRAY